MKKYDRIDFSKLTTLFMTISYDADDIIEALESELYVNLFFENTKVLIEELSGLYLINDELVNKIFKIADHFNYEEVDEDVRFLTTVDKDCVIDDLKIDRGANEKELFDIFKNDYLTLTTINLDKIDKVNYFECDHFMKSYDFLDENLPHLIELENYKEKIEKWYVDSEINFFIDLIFFKQLLLYNYEDDINKFFLEDYKYAIFTTIRLLQKEPGFYLCFPEIKDVILNVLHKNRSVNNDLNNIVKVLLNEFNCLDKNVVVKKKMDFVESEIESRSVIINNLSELKTFIGYDIQAYNYMEGDRVDDNVNPYLLGASTSYFISKVPNIFNEQNSEIVNQLLKPKFLDSQAKKQVSRLIKTKLKGVLAKNEE